MHDLRMILIDKLEIILRKENVLFFGITEIKTNKSDIDLFLLIENTDFRNIDLFCENILIDIDKPILISKRGYIDDYGFGIQIIGESGIRYDFNIMPVFLLNNKWREKVDIVIIETEEGKLVFSNFKVIDWDKEQRAYLQSFLIEYTKVYKAYTQRKREMIVKYYVRLYEGFHKILMCRDKKIPNNGEVFRKEGGIPKCINGDILEVVIDSSEKMYLYLKNKCADLYRLENKKFELAEQIRDFYISDGTEINKAEV